MPYQTIIFEQFSLLGYEVTAFYLDKKRKTPFSPPEIKNVKYFPISTYSKEELIKYLLDKKPIVLVVAGWSCSIYKQVSKVILHRNICPVVCAIDTQYLKRLKQIAGIIASKFFIRNTFSHIWIPGPRQYEFARLLGYSRDRIIFNSLSGNTDIFKKASIEHKKENYPKRILYVGRFSKEKGIELLIDAWNACLDRKGWILTFVGNGPMEKKLRNNVDVEVYPFMDQTALTNLAEQSGCFILPSTYEPWALVLHEFAAAGLPIICTDTCGASDTFVINRYNGFIIKSNCVESIKDQISRIVRMPINEMISFSYRSRLLSERISPQISAMSLLGILNENPN